MFKPRMRNVYLNQTQDKNIAVNGGGSSCNSSDNSKSSISSYSRNSRALHMFVQSLQVLNDLYYHLCTIKWHYEAL